MTLILNLSLKLRDSEINAVFLFIVLGAIIVSIIAAGGAKSHRDYSGSSCIRGIGQSELTKSIEDML